MAQPPAQPSGSEVSQVESDIQQTLDLAGTIVTLVREPIALLYQSVVKIQNLKRSLGIWQDRVLESNGYCNIPVLRLKEFEEYLVSIDGLIPASTGDPQFQTSDGSRKFRMSWDWASWKTPRSSSSSCPTLPAAGTACWAYFLFAMGIHPGTEINIDCNRRKLVDRKPPTDGFISTQNGGIEMEVDGAVLCHVFNLYSEDYPPRPEIYARKKRSIIGELKPSDWNECSLPFGRFGWDFGTHTQLHAHFSPGIETELISEKRPLDGFGFPMDGNIITSYLNALHHNVSDSRYQLAPPRAPLPERLRRLVTCFEMLQKQPTSELRYNDPLVMSYEWFEEAASVKRRVLTNGGEDHSFFQDIMKLCGTSVEREGLRHFFLVEKNMFEIGALPPGTRRRLRSTVGPPLPVWVVEDVLSSYEACPIKSLKRNLFEMREDVLKVLMIPNSLDIGGNIRWMKVLWFTPTSDLWKETVLLGAPVPS